MGKSARILGEEFNLTAQEMNYILNKKGFLSGEPGDYVPTELGKKYATQRDFHRGNGGYARYNRYWTTTTWDDSIKDELHITPDLISEARNAVAERRRAHAEELRLAQDLANKHLPDTQQGIIPTSNNITSTSKNTNGWAIVGWTLLAAGLTYGAYKAAPYVKQWWNNKVRPIFHSGGKDREA